MSEKWRRPAKVCPNYAGRAARFIPSVLDFRRWVVDRPMTRSGLASALVDPAAVPRGWRCECKIARSSSMLPFCAFQMHVFRSAVYVQASFRHMPLYLVTPALLAGSQCAGHANVFARQASGHGGCI